MKINGVTINVRDICGRCHPHVFLRKVLNSKRTQLNKITAEFINAQ